MEVTFNAEKYIDYCQMTQERWMLFKYINTVELFERFSKAIAGSTIVQEICLMFEDPENVGLQTKNIYSLASALESNCSLVSLDLKDLHHSTACDLRPLLDVLARKNQLHSLHFRCHRDTPMAEIFPSLLNLCRSATNLRKLSLLSDFNDEQVLQLLEALNEHSNLTALAIEDADNWSRLTLAAVAQFLNNNKNVKRFPIYSSEATESLAELGADPSVIKDSTRRDYDDDKPIKTPVDPTPEPYCHEPNTSQLFLDVLPLEIAKTILYSLNIGPLTAFLRANKRTQEFYQSYNFWRDYYLTYFDCIPKDVLEAMSFTYGNDLLEKSQVEEVYPSNVWRQAFRTMKEIYDYKPKYFPQRDDISPLLQLATKSFPQLNASYPFCKTSDDGFVWLSAEGSVVEDRYLAHKLGIQYNKKSGYNAIFLLKWQYEDHMFSVSQFEYLKYIFEWVQAKTATELAAKLKPLCEMFVLLRYNTDYTCHKQIIPQYKEQFYFSNLRRKAFSVHTEIEKKAEILSSIAVENLQHIERTIMKIKESVLIDLDINLYAQRLLKRSELNAQKRYLHQGLLYDFNTGGWEQQLPAHKTTAGQMTKKQREPKRVLKALVLRLIRVMLNYLMVPMLRAFWPQNVADPDFNYHNYVNRRFKPPYQQHFTPYIAIDQVSVVHSSPKHWPTIAVAIARLILSATCNIAADIIQDKPAHSNTTQLLDVLQAIGLHSKSTLDELRTTVLSWQV